jgi:murein L,D-transpeptidase YafK
LPTYASARGRNPLGHKQQEGDGRTPEGRYVLDYRNPRSSYHKALHVSYPTAADTSAASRRGVKPGGQIMVHGVRNGLGFVGRLHRIFDWTDGCIALTDAEIDEIWRSVADGTPIDIEP